MATWQAVCSKCGKGGSCTSRPDNLGRPTYNPPSMGGTCPSSSDKKHKPRWVKIS